MHLPRLKNTTIGETLNLNTLRCGCLALIFFLISIPTHAQLANFTLNVSATPETCLGNGSLSFAPVGATSGASIMYSIYLLPNLTTPVETLAGGSLGGLFSGDYTVIATQTLGGESNTAEFNITIPDQIVLLNYTVSSINAFCGPDGSMIINVLSGNPAQYEILSGPVMPPIQTTPFFDNIPAGVYVVRVYDTCGEAMVVTHTVQSDATQVTAQPATFPDTELPSCDTITASNILNASENDALTYPLTLDYTIFPPDGSPPIELSQVLGGSMPDGQEALMIIPFYHDQEYTYQLVITDDCGNTFTSTHTVNEELEIFLTPLIAECGQYYLQAIPVKYVGPYTLTFTVSPGGFNPNVANTDYPGPFTITEVGFGSFTNPVPFGDYTIQITDACGRIATGSAVLEYIEPDPVYQGTPNLGCDGNLSSIEISLPGYSFVSAIITAAPATYTAGALPHDVSAFIDSDGILVMANVPAGNYTVILTDDCGNVYDFDFEVLASDPNVAISIRADCDTGFGSIRIRGNNTQIISVIMNTAPAPYTETMPYNVSFNINGSGIFSMAELPAGTYTFTIVDSCGFTHNKTVVIPVYAVTASDFLVTPHCGSFDLNISYTANGFSSVNFWLQEYNPITSSWGHPLTGFAYTEGTLPNALNSLALVNNSNNLNLEYTGDFRLVRTYEGFGNGATGDFKMCFDVAHEFTFTGMIEITGIEKVTCNGFFSDVEVFTNGVPPVYYKITHKNGNPFLIDNGTNSVFTNLEAAVYTFAVSHSCGDTRTREYDVSLLPSLAIANQPPNMETCDTADNDSQSQFNLSDQNAAILGSQNPANYTLTYHANLADAEAGTNALATTLNSGNTTIYARLSYNNSVDCYAVTYFDLIVNPYPLLQMDTTYGLCDGQIITISADPGFDSYTWSTGATTRTITVSEPGSYTVTVTRDYANMTCSGEQTVSVVLSNVPEIETVTFTDWTDSSNTITVTLTAGSLGTHLYSLDNIHFQASPVFTGLTPGPYTVYVKDEQECGDDQAEVYLLNYPNFFTPNGDGFNDYWRIPFSEVEPHLETFIFDRYGKLITGFGVDSQGWDGTLNGKKLPSTDYWFLVIREDGSEKRGHFSMKR